MGVGLGLAYLPPSFFCPHPLSSPAPYLPFAPAAPPGMTMGLAVPAALPTMTPPAPLPPAPTQDEEDEDYDS